MAGTSPAMTAKMLVVAAQTSLPDDTAVGARKRTRTASMHGAGQAMPLHFCHPRARLPSAQAEGPWLSIRALRSLRLMDGRDKPGLVHRMRQTTRRRQDGAQRSPLRVLPARCRLREPDRSMRPPRARPSAKCKRSLRQSNLLEKAKP